MSGFVDLLRSLIADDSVESSEHERTVHLAAAALLYEVAMADTEVVDSERQRIQRLLEEAFSLSPLEAEALAGEGRMAAETATSLHSFTALVRDSWTMEERGELIDHLWAVVWADGRLDAHEQHLMRKLASLLYIPHTRYVAAKLKAVDRAVDSLSK